MTADPDDPPPGMLAGADRELAEYDTTLTRLLGFYARDRNENRGIREYDRTNRIAVIAHTLHTMLTPGQLASLAAVAIDKLTDPDVVQ